MLARLEVIEGPMFAGKSEELMRRMRIERIARRRVLVIKPYIDSRTKAYIAARAIGADGQSYETERVEALAIRDDEELAAALAAPMDTIVADECQFFGESFAHLVRNALRIRCNENLLILCAGLDTTYAMKGFGPMPALRAMADEVHRLAGICMRCFARGARLTQRTSGSTDDVQVGDKESYEVRCIACHYVFGEEQPPSP